MTMTIRPDAGFAPGLSGDTVWLTLRDPSVATARQVIHDMATWSVTLPDAVRVVVVDVAPAEALTVELVTAFAIARRILRHRGRRLVLGVSGVPASEPAQALLASIPVLRSETRAPESARDQFHEPRPDDDMTHHLTIADHTWPTT